MYNVKLESRCKDCKNDPCNSDEILNCIFYNYKNFEQKVKVKETKIMNKKLFISVPMNGYTDDEIDKMINYLKDTAEAYFGEFFDVLETHRFVRVPKNAKNDRIYMLGDSIKQYLSKADYYIGITDKDCVDYLIRGCAVENLVWKIYYPNEENALFCDYSIMCKNLKIPKRKAAKRKAGK